VVVKLIALGILRNYVLTIEARFIVIFFITYTVVLFSIVFQGLSIGTLVQKLYPKGNQKYIIMSNESLYLITNRIIDEKRWVITR